MKMCTNLCTAVLFIVDKNGNNKNVLLITSVDLNGIMQSEKKKANLKRSHTIHFHLYDTIVMTKL